MSKHEFYLHDILYETTDRDREIFGAHYQPPGRFEHGQEYLVARYEKEPRSDGNPVEIYEQRWPARFYRLVAVDSTDSLGRHKSGGVLHTGSGDEVGRLMAQLAREITRGMVAFK